MPPGDGVLLPLPGEDANGESRRMAGGGWEPHKCPPSMGATVKDTWVGKGRCKNFGAISHGGRAGDPVCPSP